MEASNERTKKDEGNKLKHILLESKAWAPALPCFTKSRWSVLFALFRFQFLGMPLFPKVTKPTMPASPALSRYHLSAAAPRKLP